MSGKWHLGFEANCVPHSRGFDRSLALLPGAANHFAFEPQFAKPDVLTFFERIPPLYSRDGLKEQFDANTANDPAQGFYSSDTYADNLIDYLRDWHNSSSEPSPFFAYLPFAAPHWPLQCSKEDRDRYKGVYDGGPGELREKRLERLTDIGIHPKGVEAYPVVAPEAYAEWDEMTQEEKSLSCRAMETYSGMVTA